MDGKMIKASQPGIVAIDIGNTSTVFAPIRSGSVRGESRLPTHQLSGLSVASLRRRFSAAGYHTAVIASVVPSAVGLIRSAFSRPGVFEALVVGRDLKVPIVNKYRSPKQVGVDRLLNALAAYEQTCKECIVIDFGTAITLDIVSKKGEYLGGVIAPGIEISLDALFKKTALLPKIRLAHPGALIGKDTVESIRVGCSVGIGGLCDRLIDRISKAYRMRPVVIATGGYAPFMKRYCERVDSIDRTLTLKGIESTYKKFLTSQTQRL